MKRLVAVLMLVSGVSYAAQMGPIKWDDSSCSIECSPTITGNLTVAGTSAQTGATTLSGLLTLTSSSPYSVKVASVTAAVPSGTPSAAGLIAFDLTYVMYVSTGTGAGAWVKVGGQ